MNMGKNNITENMEKRWIIIFEYKFATLYSLLKPCTIYVQKYLF